MPNSTIKLQDIVDDAASLGDVAPALATGGVSDGPALSIATDVMQAIINGGPVGQPYNWKWNRFNVAPFLTISNQQDYFIPGLTNLGWLESCWAVNINQTSIPKQKFQLEVKKDLEVTYDETGYPGKICWLPNDQLQTGYWGSSPLGPGGTPGPPSVKSVNATGTANFFSSSPLGQSTFGAVWSNFSYPSAGFPSDAAIVGIYPAMIVARTAYTEAFGYAQYGTNLNPWSVDFGAGGQVVGPWHTSVALNAVSPPTMFWGDSIGTDISVLNDQQMSISLQSTLSIGGLNDTLTTYGMGYAVVYSSANPIIDPTLTMPFDLLTGQGVAWALPLSVTTAPFAQPNNGQGSIVATTGQVTIIPYPPSIGLKNPGPNVIYTNPLGAVSGPENATTCITDPNGNLWALTTFGICGRTVPIWPTNPVYPTVLNPLITATTVQDGTCVWTAINPKGQGMRLNPIPPQTGIVWLIQPVGQKRSPRFTSIGQYLEPIPDDYATYFKQGFFAECYRRHPDPKVRQKYTLERQLFLEALDRAVRQADREQDDVGFYPGSNIMDSGPSINPINPANPFGPG